MVILYPNHAPWANLAHDGLCKRQVCLTVSEPVALVEIHFSGVIMEKGPEDRVGEAVVVLVCDIVVEIDGQAGILFHEPLVDDGAVLVGDEEARPSNPSKVDGSLEAREGRYETSRGHFKVIFALCILGDCDGEAIGDDYEVLCVSEIHFVWKKVAGVRPARCGPGC